MKLKRTLTEIFITDNLTNQIITLLELANLNYKPYEPDQYIYKQILDFSARVNNLDSFIELTYTNLIAWNMNQRSAKLSEYSIYNQSLKNHIDLIEKLCQLRLEALSQSDLLNLKENLKILFTNLNLVGEGKPKLVTFSKALHFFLPNLITPIDRKYTIKFFYNNKHVPKSHDKQFEMFWVIFQQFNEFATSCDLIPFINDKRNRNIPKLIDNIIIGYIKQEEKLSEVN